MDRSFTRKNTVLDEHRQAVIQDFFAFCEAHPQLRLWQALAVWSGGQIFFRRHESAPLIDTFSFEDRNG